MDTVADKQVTWKSRDAWLCVLALIVSQFIVLFWIRQGARNSPNFSHWLGTALGSAFTVVVQGGLWLFFGIWFSHVESIQGFLGPAGLKQGVTIFGWCASWLAIGIAVIDGYGASRGLTASATQPHPIGYDAFGMAWCFFALKSIVIVPFYEEVVTRGFLYRAFRASYGVFLTTGFIVVFAAYFHWGSVSRSLYSFGCLALLWALLCIVREQTGSLWGCLLCHAVYNSVGIHLWLPTIIAMLLFLPFVAHPILDRWRAKARGLNPDA
jgi:membrane protease YdiL (CAAX protease family)